MTTRAELTVPVEVRPILGLRTAWERAAKVKRMAKAAAEWGERPHSDFRKASFLDALSHCIDSDLQEETDNTMRECGLDTEGFPLDSYGDRELRADRVFIPIGDAA